VTPPPPAAELRAAFDEPAPLTVGIEEELMLLDPVTLDLVPRAPEALAALAGDERFKPELPLAQLEIVTPPCETVGEAAGLIAAGRRDLVTALGDLARPAAAGVHPFAAAAGELNPAPRYERIRREYGWVARRQLVFALQLHVAVRPAARALGVYGALRSHLPELAALAANAPFYGGEDTGLASVRPKLAEALPRQGVPPAFASWEELGAALEWAKAAGAVPHPPHEWWWELRLHPRFGTLEVRVPDAQATIADAAGVAAAVHALVHRLAARHDAGDLPPPAPRWRIEENRWAACRHGLDGTLADLETGRAIPARERLDGLLGELRPHAAAVGCAPELAHARALVERNGAERLRAVGREGGARAVAGELAALFPP
jgi:glutamate---cysteine ligase / carboxylate-amine ligase